MSGQQSSTTTSAGSGGTTTTSTTTLIKPSPINSSAAGGNVMLKDRITLIVDETPFVVDAKLFTSHQNTLLGRMFGNKNFELKPNSRGEFDIGRGTCLTSSIFRLIIVK